MKLGDFSQLSVHLVPSAIGTPVTYFDCSADVECGVLRIIHSGQVTVYPDQEWRELTGQPKPVTIAPAEKLRTDTRKEIPISAYCLQQLNAGKLYGVTTADGFVYLVPPPAESKPLSPSPTADTAHEMYMALANAASHMREVRRAGLWLPLSPVIDKAESAMDKYRSEVDPAAVDATEKARYCSNCGRTHVLRCP